MKEYKLIFCWDAEKKLIDFKMGGVVCLKRFEDGKWAVEWDGKTGER